MKLTDDRLLIPLLRRAGDIASASGGHISYRMDKAVIEVDESLRAHSRDSIKRTETK